MGKKHKTWEDLMDELGMTQRNDDIDNATHRYICDLAEKDVEWNAELIASIEDSSETILEKFGIDVCHPAANEDNEDMVLCSEDEEFNCPIRKRGECKFKLPE